MNHRVYFGDSRRMSELEDQSVHLVVTSPPYWQLKDYGAEGQIGFNDSHEEYLKGLEDVWRECYRVLHDGCRLCINIGDQFARAKHYGRYKVVPLHADMIRLCEGLGFDYMGAIVWRKATSMNTSGGAVVMGSFPQPRNGIVKIDYEWILLFKKLGTPPRVTARQKEASRLTTAEWNEYFSGHWSFPGERQGKGKGHLAMFPLELPRRLIRMFSFPGETVLDPFLGSGTTLQAASALGRCGVGYEINHEFQEAIENRLGARHLRSMKFISSRATDEAMAVSEEVQVEPLNRRVDPKKHRFNSIIEMGDFDKKPRRRPVAKAKPVQATKATSTKATSTKATSTKATSTKTASTPATSTRAASARVAAAKTAATKLKTPKVKATTPTRVRAGRPALATKKVAVKKD